MMFPGWLPVFLFQVLKYMMLCVTRCCMMRDAVQCAMLHDARCSTMRDALRCTKNTMHLAYTEKRDLLRCAALTLKRQDAYT